MALVHRVNANFSPLLNTFYCKCVVNITRFKTNISVKDCRRTSDEDTVKNYQSFTDMIAFRQNQAKRSILVKLNSFDHLHDLTQFCNRYGKIIKCFPYHTNRDCNFVLIELESVKDCLNLREIGKYKLSEDIALPMTSLFVYNPRGGFTAKKNYPKSSEICPYSKFHIPSLKEIKDQLILIKSLSDQMISLYDILKITDLNIRLRFSTAELIFYHVSKMFKNLTVVPFGSSVNGFGQTGCDLDLLCKTTSFKPLDTVWKKFFYMVHPFNLLDRTEQKEFLEIISIVLKTCVPNISGIKKILEARVPIIKFHILNTNMQCDLSSTNTIALHMSELLYLYGQMDCRVKPLVFTIRKWARNWKLTRDTPGHWITNFSLTLLIIFYLQTKSVLPSLNVIKYYSDISKKNVKSEYCDISWFLQWKRITKRNNPISEYNLLYGFFEYYSLFNFKSQAVCIREGQLKSKKDNSPLYIYNPFDATLNVSKNVTTLELARITDFFRNALHILLESQETDAIINLIDSKAAMHLLSQSTHVANLKISNVITDKDNEEGVVIDEELLNDFNDSVEKRNNV